MSGNKINGDVQKDRHLKLAAVVKAVHAKLRKHYKQLGDFDQVWMEHCRDSSLLLVYADAMHQLATEIWTKHPETRIDWCRNLSNEYYFGGGLKKVFQKEHRRKLHHQVSKAESLAAAQMQQLNSEKCDGVKTCMEDSDIHNVNTLPASSNKIQDYSQVNQVMSQNSKSCQSLDSRLPDESSANVEEFLTSSSTSPLTCNILSDAAGMMASQTNRNVSSGSEHTNPVNSETGSISGDPDSCKPDTAPSTTHDHKMKRYSNTITLPFEGRIRLLDVGSCYNAFQEFDEFEAVGIDISPAVESVHYCDFLHLDILEPLQLETDSVGAFLCNIRSPVESFPMESFHVIVFSLLLEYFPSTHQRWICCRKAHELLLVNGILIIITPDSNHQNKNAPMMKSWKIAIESLGFVRWRYVKLEHLHCMVFRKIKPQDMASVISDVKPDMLYIPQDFNTSGDEVTNPLLLDNDPQTHEDVLQIKNNFEELPDYED